MFKKIFKTMDYSIVIIVLFLFGTGLVALYSANGGARRRFRRVKKTNYVVFI
jgi:cell division protein FtsW (lipid II flippase)